MAQPVSVSTTEESINVHGKMLIHFLGLMSVRDSLNIQYRAANAQAQYSLFWPKTKSA